MKVDLLLDTFGSSWQEVRDGALMAEQAGLDGVWVNDHLAGSVENADSVLECWTVLSALAASVPRLSLGPLVLNVANRDPGTLAVMAATLQHVSGGRLLVGIGAGGGPGSIYATEQEALGHPVLSDADRREKVDQTITTLHRVWSGSVPPASGFLRPAPVPPIVVAAVGSKMAELAGRVGDGICVRAGPAMTGLVALARRSRERSDKKQQPLLVIATREPWADGPQPPVASDVDRLIIPVSPPFDQPVAELGEMAKRGRA